MRGLTPSLPTTYTLELTAACNHRCVGCERSEAGSASALSSQEWMEILERLKPHVYALRLTGGEPTLHPDFAEIVRFVDTLGVPFVLFTNSRWTDPPALLGIFVECTHLDGLLISLHGADAETHQAFTGRDSFAEVTANIHLATQAGLQVGTNAVITHANRHQFQAIADMAFSLGASSAAFSRYYGQVHPLTNLSADEFRAAVQEVAQLHAQDRRIIFNNCVPQCFADVPTKGCPSGLTHCTIGPTGDVRPCNHVPLAMGNLLEQSIKEIWASDVLRRWREMVPAQCQTCTALPDCGGGCRSVAWQLGLEADPLIREPYSPDQHQAERIRLYEGARPVSRFVVKQEEFGYLLINRSVAVPVNTTAQPVLKACDGTMTLHEIERHFGQQALNLVGLLVKKGLMELA